MLLVLFFKKLSLWKFTYARSERYLTLHLIAYSI